MSDDKKLSLKEKEQKLLKQIERAKQQLGRLYEKRKSELAQLACKHGLDSYDNAVLDKAFKKLAGELADEHA